MKTYIINLPERTERLAQAKAELEKYGITDYEVFEAIKHENGKLGIYLTMYKLIEQAYFGGVDYMSVFEDDIKIVNCKEGKLRGISDSDEIRSPEINFDIFYYGCNTHDPADRRTPLQIIGYNYPEPEIITNNTILRVLDAYGCHAMLLSRNGMFKILNAIKKEQDYFTGYSDIGSFEEMYTITKYNRPIDVLIQQEIQPDGKCYCTNPIIATQRSGYSDIEKKEMNQDYIETRFNQNVKRLFASLILILFLLGCSGIKRGKVVNKYVKPAHYSVTYVKSGSVLVPLSTFVQDVYIVVIGDSVDHDWQTNDFTVDRAVYDKTEIGQNTSFK